MTKMKCETCGEEIEADIVAMIHHKFAKHMGSKPQTSKGGLVTCPYNQTPGGVSDWCRIWDESAKAQHVQDLAKFRQVVEDVKADNYYQHYQVVQDACDDILKALKEEA